MEFLKANRKAYIFVLIIALGLVAAIYLSQNPQILKSRAGAEINSALNVTDNSGNELEYQGNNTYKTKSLDVQIGIKDLQELK